MYVSAGVWGVATALPVVEPRIQCHYFPDAPRMLYCVTLLGDVFHQHAFVRWLRKKDQFSQKCLWSQLEVTVIANCTFTTTQTSAVECRCLKLWLFSLLIMENLWTIWNWFYTIFMSVCILCCSEIELYNSCGCRMVQRHFSYWMCVHYLQKPCTMTRSSPLWNSM